MPHFCSKGHYCGEYICQVCGKVHCAMCDGKDSVWGKIPGKNFEGNICPDCQKKNSMEQAAERYGVEVFGRSRSDCIDKKICVRCGNKAGLFTSKIAVQEYQKTGFCQKCQDVVFAEVD